MVNFDEEGQSCPHHDDDRHERIMTSNVFSVLTAAVAAIYSIHLS